MNFVNLTKNTFTFYIHKNMYKIEKLILIRVKEREVYTSFFKSNKKFIRY
jgi:dTDP-4-dehydrorhamnose 3,5-epimerase-like enzyme